MNLLSRRSMLAIAAVVDIALHSRSAPVAAKALAAGIACRRGIWRRCCKASCTPRS